MHRRAGACPMPCARIWISAGVKVGCDAGDCGACTVLLNGEPICSCLTALGQVNGAAVETVEGLGDALAE